MWWRCAWSRRKLPELVAFSSKDVTAATLMIGCALCKEEALDKHEGVVWKREAKGRKRERAMIYDVHRSNRRNEQQWQRAAQQLVCVPTASAILPSQSLLLLSA